MATTTTTTTTTTAAVVVMEGTLKVRRASPPSTFLNHPAGFGGGTRWCVRHFVLTPTELIQKTRDGSSASEETYYVRWRLPRLAPDGH